MLTILLVIIYISFISLGLPDSLLGSAWPAINGDLGTPLSYAGILSFICTGGTIISSLFSDKLIRRLGTGKVTAVSVFLTAVALLGISFSPGFIWMCLMTVPLGLGAGSVDAALNNFVALHYKARHMSWLHCFWGIGATSGPIIMSLFLGPANGWKMGYRTIGIIQAILVVILFVSLPLWEKVNKTQDGEEQEVPELSLNKLLKIPGCKPSLVAYFCYCALEITAGLWGSSYLVIERGVSAGTAAKWISLYYFGITAGRFLSGLLVSKLNNKNMIRLGCGIIGFGILLIFTGFHSFLLQAGFVCIGLGCAPVYPCMLQDTPNRFGRELSQSLMGIQMACAYVGSCLMPPVFGFIAQHISISLFPLYLCLILALMIYTSERLYYLLRKQKS